MTPRQRYSSNRTSWPLTARSTAAASTISPWTMVRLAAGLSEAGLRAKAVIAWPCANPWLRICCPLSLQWRQIGAVSHALSSSEGQPPRSLNTAHQCDVSRKVGGMDHQQGQDIRGRAGAGEAGHQPVEFLVGQPCQVSIGCGPHGSLILRTAVYHLSGSRLPSPTRPGRLESRSLRQLRSGPVPATTRLPRARPARSYTAADSRADAALCRYCSWGCARRGPRLPPRPVRARWRAILPTAQSAGLLIGHTRPPLTARNRAV